VHHNADLIFLTLCHWHYIVITFLYFVSSVSLISDGFLVLFVVFFCYFMWATYVAWNKTILIENLLSSFCITNTKSTCWVACLWWRSILGIFIFVSWSLVVLSLYVSNRCQSLIVSRFFQPGCCSCCPCHSSGAWWREVLLLFVLHIPGD